MQQPSPIIIYQTDDGQMQIDVRMENETVLLNYNYALDTLDNYDYERLKIDKITNAGRSTPRTKMQWRQSTP